MEQTELKKIPATSATGKLTKEDLSESLFNKKHLELICRFKEDAAEKILNVKIIGVAHEDGSGQKFYGDIVFLETEHNEREMRRFYFSPEGNINISPRSGSATAHTGHGH